MAIAEGRKVPQTPVLDLLAEAVSDFPEVPLQPLHTLIDARQGDLAYPSMSSLDDLSAFASDTQGSLIYVHASALAGRSHDAAKLKTVCLEAGKAVGLAILLRGAAAHASARLTYMPRDLAHENNVPQSELLTGGENASKVFRAVAGAAEGHLVKARTEVSDVDRGARPAFWPLFMSEIYLKRLRKSGFDPFNERLQMSMRTSYSLVLQAKLLAARILRR